MPDPHCTLWTLLGFRAALAVCTAPLFIGLWPDLRWLTQVGFILVFVFILACYGFTMEQERHRREEQEREEKDERGERE